MPIEKPSYQLSFTLDLPEEDKSYLSVEEVRLRSETARQALEGKTETDLPWMKDYRHLRDGNWDWRVAAYMAWESSPQPRTPKTQDELARKYLGLTSDRAIATWRKKNPAIAEMIATLGSAPLWDSRSKDFEVLNEGAEKAGRDYKFFKHLELKFLMRQDYVPANKLMALIKNGNFAKSDLDDYSDEELRVIRTTLLEELNGRDGLNKGDEENAA